MKKKRSSPITQQACNAGPFPPPKEKEWGRSEFLEYPNDCLTPETLGGGRGTDFPRKFRNAYNEGALSKRGL